MSGGPLSSLFRVAGGRWWNKNTLESEYRSVGLIRQADDQYAMMTSGPIALQKFTIYNGWPDDSQLLPAVKGIAYVIYRWTGFNLAVAGANCSAGLYVTTHANSANRLLLTGFDATAGGDFMNFNEELNYQTPDGVSVVFADGAANNQGYSYLYYNQVRVS